MKRIDVMGLLVAFCVLAVFVVLLGFGVGRYAAVAAAPGTDDALVVHVPGWDWSEVKVAPTKPTVTVTPGTDAGIVYTPPKPETTPVKLPPVLPRNWGPAAACDGPECAGRTAVKARPRAAVATASPGGGVMRGGRRGGLAARVAGFFCFRCR